MPTSLETPTGAPTNGHSVHPGTATPPRSEPLLRVIAALTMIAAAVSAGLPVAITGAVAFGVGTLVVAAALTKIIGPSLAEIEFATYLATAVVASGLTFASAAQLAAMAGRRWGAGRTVTDVLVRRPWFTSGLGLFIATIIGTLMKWGYVGTGLALASAAWWFLTAVYVVLRFALLLTNVAWHAIRMSNAMAVVSSVVSTAATVVALMLGVLSSVGIHSLVDRIQASPELEEVRATLNPPQQPDQQGAAQESSLLGLSSAGADVVRNCWDSNQELAKRGMWWLNGKMGDWAEAQDVAYALLTEICLSRKRFDSPKALQDYYFRSLMNAVSDWKRLQIRTCPIDSAPAAGCGLYKDDRFLSYEDRLAFHQILCGMSPADQQLILWVHLDGKDYDTIGRELGISPGNARVRLSRAVAAFREEFDERCQ